MRVRGWVVEALTLSVAMANNLLFSSMVASLAVVDSLVVSSSIFEYFKLLFLNPHGMGDAYQSNSFRRNMELLQTKRQTQASIFLSRVLTPVQSK